MDRHTKWMTIEPFQNIRPLDLYHKELSPAPAPPENAPRNLHVLVRKRLRFPPQKSVTLQITADDYYKLYMNGRFVCQGPAPAYPEHYYYNEPDLSPFLKEGDNLLAVHLYYQGLVNRVWNSGDLRFGMAAELFCGGEPFAACDGTWKYSVCRAYSGETTGYETQFLENFDSRLWEQGWNLPGFDDGAWLPMKEAAWADYRLFRQPTAPLDVHTLHPRFVEKRPGNRYFIDMGGEIAGALRAEARGGAGQKIRVLCGEELDERGDVRFDMRCNCRYEETWMLKDGVSLLEPYDYKGFRYAQLVADEGVELLDIHAEARHYPMGDGCVFSCADRELEEIFSICRNAVKYGTQEGYLDCPTREKGQYLGDAAITSRAQVWLTGNPDMLLKSIGQFAQTSRICPGLMAVAPGGLMQEIADFSLLWPQLLLQYYDFTGDRRTLREYYPTARGIVSYFSRYERGDGLLEQVGEKWNLVDWPENLRDDYDFPLTRPLVGPGVHNQINALYLGALKTLERLEDLLELPRSKDHRPVLDAYLRAFYRPRQDLLADSETSGHCSIHANAYAMYFGLLPKKVEKAAADMLLEKGLNCGVLTSYFILKALAGIGRHDALFTLLTGDGPHGWKNMLREGATACFEAWGKDQKWNTSLCHPWACAPIPLLIEEIAGVRLSPENPDGFVFEPHIPKELPELRLAVPLRGKKILVTKNEGKPAECRISENTKECTI